MKKKGLSSRFLLAASLCVALGGPAAAERLRVGTAVANDFGFLPVKIAVVNRLDKKYGLTLDIIGFQGGAKLHQAMVAGAIDVALGAGTDLLFILKGAPEMAVAARSKRPPVGIIVRWNFPGNSIVALKGKRIGVTTVGSMTAWLMHRLMREQGWPPDAITLVPIGGRFANQTALLTTGQIDGFVGSSAFGLALEAKQRGRVLLPLFDMGGDFLAEAIYASDHIIKTDPSAVRRFLKLWFDTIVWMRHHKAQAVALLRRYTKFSRAVEDREYDLLMPNFSIDGRFHPAAVRNLERAFIERHQMPKSADLTKYITEKFLPVNKF